MPELILCVAAVLREAGLAVVVEGSHFDVRRRRPTMCSRELRTPLPWRNCVVPRAVFRVHRGWTG
jgi:hypothetical protein